MLRFRHLTALAIVLFTGAVLIAQQPGEIRTIATTLEVMETMTIPLSDAVFEAAAEPPRDDAAWAALRQKAVALAEAGNLLLLGSRVVDQSAWVVKARAQVDGAAAVADAAAAKDADRLSTTGDALYDTCVGCHALYPPN